MNNSNAISECQICNSNKLYHFLSLGHQPPSDRFLTEEKLKESETHHPIDLYFCENCNLVQLGYAVDPSILFTESFIYTTGSSKELVDNFHLLVELIVNKFKVSQEDLVIDIGSNDGTLLENYLPYNIRVLGIDPSKAAELAIKKNTPTLLKFFNETTAEDVVREHGKAKIITATNVFAHVKELNSFMNGVKLLLDDNGIFIEESGYLPDLISKTEYDAIYAEHLRYYSLRPLIHLFNKFGMDVFDVEKITTHGGSLRVFSCKKGDFLISDNVPKLLKEEEMLGYYSREIYDNFTQKVLSNRESLRSILFNMKSQGNTIVGIGAPAKGNTLLNFCKIGKETLDFLLEKGNLKVGMYSPGMHIKVVEESVLFDEYSHTHALLLSWNLKDIIVPKLRAKGFKGKIIVPVPIPHIL